MADSSQTLVTPNDTQKLRSIIETIEADDTMCFKMRWYVARHVRDNFFPFKAASKQKFTQRVRWEHTWDIDVSPDGLQYQKLVKFNPRHLNRLDFEAERAQCQFVKDQPGWQYSRITQILQRAYEEHNWSPTVTEADVDTVLEEAGADLTLFKDATKVEAVEADANVDASSATMSRSSQPLAPASQKQEGPSQANANNATRNMRKSTPPSGTNQSIGPRPEAIDDIEAIREKNETFRSKAHREIGALRSEVLQLKHTVDGAMQSMDRLKVTQEGFQTGQDNVLSEIKSLREALSGKDMKNQEWNGGKREKRKRRDKDSGKGKKIRKLMKRVAKELEESSSSSDSSSSPES